MNIDGLRSLTVFVRVVQDGGFTAAAATLGVSTSAVSQAIRQLEKEAGVRLLNRTTRSVGLSEAGAEFYHRVSPLVRELQDWSPPARLSLYYFNRGSIPLKLRVFIDFMQRA